MHLPGSPKRDPTAGLGQPMLFTIGPVTRRADDHHRLGPIVEPVDGYLTVERVWVSGGPTADDCSAAFHENGLIVTKRTKRRALLRRTWSEARLATVKIVHLPAVHGKQISVHFVDGCAVNMSFIPLRSAAAVQQQEMVIRDLRSELKAMDDSADWLLSFLQRVGIGVETSADSKVPVLPQRVPKGR